MRTNDLAGSICDGIMIEANLSWKEQLDRAKNAKKGEEGESVDSRRRLTPRVNRKSAGINGKLRISFAYLAD